MAAPEESVNPLCILDSDGLNLACRAHLPALADATKRYGLARFAIRERPTICPIFREISTIWLPSRCVEAHGHGKVSTMSRGRRGLFVVEEPVEDPGQFGCPMLARSRFNPIAPDQPAWRCNIGWAIHGTEEAVFCQATESVADCWKVHPERLPVVEIGTVMRTESKAAAD